MRLSFFVATIMLGITGCAGGSGGGSGAAGVVAPPVPSIVSFTNFSSVRPDSTVRMSGRAVTGQYRYDLNQNVVSGIISDAFGDLTANVTVGNQFGAGNITNSTISPTNGAPVSFNCVTDTCSDTDPSFPGLEVLSADKTQIILLAAPADQNFEYQTFGVWVTGLDTGAGEFGAMSVGAKTSASSIQAASGTASYSGFSTGYLAAAGDGILYAPSTPH